jgi:hypothetical protein
MAREQKQISGLHHPSKSHEEARVEKQSSRHTSGYHRRWFRVEVKSTRSNKTPVSGWSPKVHSLWADR